LNHPKPAQRSSSLALTRNNGQTIVLYGCGTTPIEITIERAKAGRARVIVRAPESISIMRQELLRAARPKPSNQARAV
jgi:sRNA-binding carbon storage regulator CsrA